MSRITGVALCLLLLPFVAGCASMGGAPESALNRAASTDARVPGLEEVEVGAIQHDELRQLSLFSNDTVLTSFPAGAESTSAPDRKPETTARLKIYTARFEVLVPNIAASIDRLMARVEEIGGYLEKREDHSVTVRVPATHFKDITEELRAYGRVVKEFTRAEDVTKKYYALKIRIENAEKSRERLLALLEKAQKVEDALKIEQELRRLTEEIELMKGEFKLLSEQIAFSTIEVHFRTNAPPPRAVRIRTRSRFPWVNQIGVEHVLDQF